MSLKKQDDLIRSFCEGAIKPLKGIPCKHYIPRDRECRLLKTGKTAEFIKKCRASTLEMLYRASVKYLKMFQQRHPGLPIDEGTDIDFRQIMERLKKIKLHRYSLIVWKGYINKVAYNAARNVLVRAGLLPKDSRCGTCRYLPWSEPHTCPKKKEERRKSDPPCEEYRWEAIIPDPIPDDESLANMTTPEILLREKEEGPLLSFIIKLLKNRIEDTAPGSKNREIYERQYDIFVSLIHSLSNGTPRTEAVNEIAQKYRIDKRTIQRDIRELREFLKKKNVLNF